jgi:hypothetical protein
MIDIEDVRPRTLQRLGRVAFEVSAVEEHDRPPVEVVGRFIDQSGERQEPILGWQRELAWIDENQAVLAEQGEDLLHRDERSKRVPIGVLVRHDDQLLG